MVLTLPRERHDPWSQVVGTPWTRLKKKANALVAEWSDNDDRFGAKSALEALRGWWVILLVMLLTPSFHCQHHAVATEQWASTSCAGVIPKQDDVSLNSA